MNIPELFIRRPVMTTLVMAGILIFGFMGYRALPVSDLPNVDFPTIQVTARLPGASPETMASSVATPLERQFARIAGVPGYPAHIDWDCCRGFVPDRGQYRCHAITTPRVARQARPTPRKISFNG